VLAVKEAAEQNIDMTEKVCMVTGANSGLGYATSLALANMGAAVVLVCRDKEKGRAARAKIIATTGNDTVKLIVADLSSQQSIRELVDNFEAKHQKLNVLVNNAGHMSAERRETVDGLEMTFAVNHLATFLLTNLLLGALQKAAEIDGEARVVNISSSAQRRGKFAFSGGQMKLDGLWGEKNYHLMSIYAGSKLAMVVASRELAHLLQGTGITVNCVGPGHMRTPFNSKAGGITGLVNTFPLSKWFIQNIIAKPVVEAALTPLYLTTSADLKGQTGLFYGDYCQLETPSRLVNNRRLSRQLWDISAQLTNMPATLYIS
jgi:NAD(P)-dependent dehydrogenase (short-subunit alcohol dehydrogenase family)